MVRAGRAFCFWLTVVWVVTAECGLGIAADVRQGPQVLRAADHGVGRFVADLSFEDLEGCTQSWKELQPSKLVVVAMTSTSCPISKKYLPTLADLAKQFAPRGVRFVLVNCVATDKLEDMRAAQAVCGDTATYVFDQDQTIAKAVGAVSTTDVIVLDPARTIVYHGAIDDQYGFGYSIDAPRRRFLVDALATVLAGRPPLVAATAAPGCALDLPAPTASPTTVTYHNRISRIIERNCVECHREGGVAPFALDSLDNIVAHAAMIKQVVERRVMPPWFASAAVKDEPSPWLNDRSLAASERADLLTWLNGGRTAGNPQDAPQPRAFVDGWTIGRPDAVFEFAQPVQVKATGTMPYQNVIVDTNLTEDKWVQAIEVRPSNRAVVHHVLVFVRSSDGAGDEGGRRRSGGDEAAGYWGIYVPGNSTLMYPDGYAKRLPKGAQLRFQVHYTPNGTATEDRTKIGLVYAKEPPQHEIRVAGIVNVRLNIPPGEANHAEVATLPISTDVQVLAFLPHMHLRGKAARYEVLHDGQAETLLDIPHYDFNWQLLYRYAEPLTLHRGDTLRFTAWYDNSAQNPANPDPTRTVHWGPQTFDEMQLGYVEYIVPGAKPSDPSTVGPPGGVAAVRVGAAVGVFFNSIDSDRDGLLSWEEVKRFGENVPRWKDNPRGLEALFKRLDVDSNGQIDKTEAAKLREAGGS